MAGVIIRNLTKRFGNVVAVNNLNFVARDGLVTALVGPSGCGKTTTLQCITGLENPTSGEIYIGDCLVNELPPKDRDVAMVFQSYALYPHMTVYDNIAFPLKIRKYSKEEIRRRVHKVVELLRISHLIDRRPKQLSGGEAQRTALGRAIVREPKVFLMDEPLSNLDAKLRVRMRAELKRLQKELGITTIYVTHDQSEAMTLANRILVLNHGVLQQMGSPSELYDKPSNSFVAGFIGAPAMNFFDCSLEWKDGECLLDIGISKITLPGNLMRMLRKEVVGSERLVFGVRPECIDLFSRKVPGSIETVVYETEPLGSETIIDFKFDDAMYKVRYTGKIGFKHGDSIWIKPDLNKIHIFDKKTQKTII